MTQSTNEARPISAKIPDSWTVVKANIPWSNCSPGEMHPALVLASRTYKDSEGELKIVVVAGMDSAISLAGNPKNIFEGEFIIPEELRKSVERLKHSTKINVGPNGIFALPWDERLFKMENGKPYYYGSIDRTHPQCKNFASQATEITCPYGGINALINKALEPIELALGYKP